MEFAIFKDAAEGRYVYCLNGPHTKMYQAVSRAYGAPAEFTQKKNYGDMPAKWRGKPMVEATVIYEHDPASGWAVGDAKNIDVRATRRAKKWSVAQLARAVGVSPRTVEDWEQGRRIPGGAARKILETLR